MLHRFITDNHDQIADRAMLLSRTRNPLPAGPPDDEISAFLTQASGRLQGGATAANSLNATARRNGAQMLRGGRTIVEVVQCYGDVCQAVTALAAESRTPISAQDFGVFNQCLDDAMGHAVGEYERIAEERRGAAEVQRLGTAAHELRDQLHTAQLALRLLQPQGAGGDGLAEQILTRALANLSQQVERMLSEVRLGAGVQRRDAIPLAAFLNEVATTAALKAASRGVTFTMESEATGTVEGDRQLLMSAVMNLVHNAVKFTASGGDVRVTARVTPTRLVLAVQDQCGGLPDMTKIGNAFSDRRGADRSGLGLGLSIAKAVIESHAGEIVISNTPGFGCIFTIDLPLVAEPARSRTQS